MLLRIYKGISLVFISIRTAKMAVIHQCIAARCLWLPTPKVTTHLCSRLMDTIKSKNKNIVEVEWTL